MEEKEAAIALANKVLDRPLADMDDDLAVLSRQFLRALERQDADPATRAMKLVNEFAKGLPAGLQVALSVAIVRAIKAGDTDLRTAAQRVCEFDWSDNDMDAVATIEELRKAIRRTLGAR